MQKKINKIPGLLSKLLDLVTAEPDRIHLNGDYEEIYDMIYRNNGRIRAHLWILKQILISITILISDFISWNGMMYKNYLKTTLRNIKRNKIYSFINMSGLAVGIACCLLVLLYVRYEMSYDHYHEKAGSIYRLGMERTSPGNVQYLGWTSVNLVQRLVADYPEVLQGVRILTDAGKTQITCGNEQFIENRVIYADSNFFKLFSISIIEGDVKSPLHNPNSVVITKSTAKKYYGDDSPLGKMFIVQNKNSDNASFTVTAVSEDVPPNSHFHYDFLFPINSTEIGRSQNTGYWRVFSYILLRNGYDHKTLETKLPDFIKKHMGPLVQEGEGMSYEEYLSLGNKWRYFLQPLRDIHLKSRLDHELEPNGNITYVYLFFFSALFILLIACINFINLSTARSLNRIKEVGIRKTVGSFRSQLIGQFLFESILLSIISLILAIGVSILLLPVLRKYTGTELPIDSLTVLPCLIAFGIFIGVVSGVYPAFFLSSFSPISIFKGKLKTGINRKSLRNVLVVLQFFISIVLIAGTGVLKKQLDYMLDKDLGYNRKGIVVVNNGSVIKDRFHSFKNELQRNPNVLNVAASQKFPARAGMAYDFTLTGSDKEVDLSVISVGYDFIKTLGMEIVQGRDFTPEMSSDKDAVIFNRSAVKAFGLTEPLKSQLDFGETAPIIGVVKDFHFRSLHYDIKPMAIALRTESRFINFISIRITPENIPNTLSYIKNVWDKHAHGIPLDFTFMEQDIEKLYKLEVKTRQTSTIFSVIAIILGCLGLFGLAAYTVEQKTKEIGIRKVLGASVINIFFFISKEFTKLVAIALIFAVPVSYYIMNNWLQNFAYRIDITAFIFIISGTLTLLIALLTVCLQVKKAACANPVEALRF